MGMSLKNWRRSFGIFGRILAMGQRKPDFSPLWMESICRGAVSRRIRLS